MLVHLVRSISFRLLVSDQAIICSNR
uniref:Uncharacterized protein n=1 Tax=Arundo donax TaxID=35708 RepID=A0A0A9AXN9_ARUDO